MGASTILVGRSPTGICDLWLPSRNFCLNGFVMQEAHRQETIHIYIVHLTTVGERSKVGIDALRLNRSCAS